MNRWHVAVVEKRVGRVRGKWVALSILVVGEIILATNQGTQGDETLALPGGLMDRQVSVRDLTELSPALWSRYALLRQSVYDRGATAQVHLDFLQKACV